MTMSASIVIVQEDEADYPPKRGYYSSLHIRLDSNIVTTSIYLSVRQRDPLNRQPHARENPLTPV